MNFRPLTVCALWISAAVSTLTPSSAFAQTLYAVDSDGGFLYQVANYTTSPTAVIIGATNRRLTDIAITPSGVGYATSTTSLYRISLTTGAVTLIRSQSVAFNSLTAGSDTTLYAATANNSFLYSIDTATGVSTQLFNTGFAANGDIALGENSNTLYLASNNNDLVRINLANNTATDVGAFGITGVFGLAWINGVLYGGTDAGPTLYTISTSNGHATPIGAIAGASSLGLNGLASTLPAVPEPGMAALLVGLVMTGAGFLSRRRKR